MSSAWPSAGSNPSALQAGFVPGSRRSPGAGAAHPYGVRRGRPYESQAARRGACRALSFSQQVASLSALLPISRSCFLLRPGCPRRGWAGAVHGGLCGPGAAGGSRNPPQQHRDISQGTKATTRRLCAAEVAKLPMAMARTWCQVPKGGCPCLSWWCAPHSTPTDTRSDLQSSSSSIPHEQTLDRVVTSQCPWQWQGGRSQHRARVRQSWELVLHCPWFSLLVDDLLVLPQRSSWMGFPQ